MPSLVIDPLTTADLDEAAELLAGRHRRQRLAEPLLDPRYEDAAVAGAELRALFARDQARGAVARRGRTMVGYVLGVPRPDASWGPNVWIEPSGHAVAEGEAETVRDLYGVLAEGWLAEGLTSHYAVVPACDPHLVDCWARLSFGKQHAHGLRELPEPAPIDPRLRRPRRDDIPALAAVENELPRHQRLSPVFSMAVVPSLEETVAEWEETFDDPRFTTFVAELEGRVVGSATACSLDESSMHVGICRPHDCGFLGFAAVLPEARGHGLGRALGEAVGQWAREAGFAGLVTDWRQTNLLSSRTWPRLGYRVAFERLHRAIA